MAQADEIFNELVALDILCYEPVETGICHDCACCGRMASWRLSDECSDAMDSERPFLYICNECHKDALSIPRWRHRDGE